MALLEATRVTKRFGNLVAVNQVDVSIEPGTIHAGITARRPVATRAAERRSSRRLLVHEPMNTQSTLVPAMGSPGLRPM